VKYSELFTILRGLLDDREAYIVGGTVRDLLLGKDPIDVDIVVSGDAADFGKVLSEKIDGTIFLLDRERRIFRIATYKDTPPYYFDISPIRENDIIADLYLRDFTIDALAIPLSDIKAIIDPLKGREDLRKRCIRVISRKSFEDDPLRLLRAFRLAGNLHFEIERDTFHLIREMSSLLRQSAAERIRDEFFNLLSTSDSTRYLHQMHRTGLLREILTGLDEGDIEAGLEVLAGLEVIYATLEDLFCPVHLDLRKYLQTEIEEGIAKGTLWKWISLYLPARVSEGSIAEAARGLRLGKKASKVALLSIRHFDTSPLDSGKDRRSLYHFFKSTGSDGMGLLLVQFASSHATKEDKERRLKIAVDAMSWYLREYREMVDRPLITGDDLIELFHIPPGPIFKRLLELVEEERAANLLSTREDALSLLKKMGI